MDALKKILIEENEFNDINYYYMQLALEDKNKYLLNKHGDLFLVVDSLIHLNNINTGSNNIGLRNVNVRPAGSYKMYMDKNDIEHELYTLVDSFNDCLVSKKDFCETFLDKIHSFRDRNGRTCKVLFIN